MKALVTGGLGFVGSNIIKALNDRDIDVYILDSLNKRNEYILKTINFVDLINKEKFYDDIIRDLGVDVVFHQGAITDTVFQDEREMTRVNLELSSNIFKQCKNSNVRLIYASSAAVYGLGDNGFREEPICESPLNIYGESKLKFDIFVRNQTVKNQVVGLRYFNIYGQNENHKMKMASPLNQFFHQAKSNSEIRLFEGSENFHRDFIYIKDVVDVNMFFLDNQNISGIFNCGTGNTSTFQDAANIVSTTLNTPIKMIPFPDILKGRYQVYTKSDVSKLRLAGYKKQFSNFEIAAASYIKSML